MATTGNRLPDSRMAVQVLYPSSPGICISNNSKSNLLIFKISNTSGPFSLIMGCMPYCSKSFVISSWFTLLSSATSTLAPLNVMAVLSMITAFITGLFSETFFAKGNSTVNTEPSPSVLLRAILPPSNAAMFFTIANPKPVPFCIFSCVFSACWKRSKIISCFFNGMPMPVSCTLNCNVISFSFSDALATASFTNPLLVNLKALLTRFTNIW